MLSSCPNRSVADHNTKSSQRVNARRARELRCRKGRSSRHHAVAIYHSPYRRCLETARLDNYTSRMTTTIPKHRRWLRYSLITLLVLVVIAGIAATWIGRTMQAWARRTEMMETIVNAGGRVRLDLEIDESGNPIAKSKPHGSAWLRPLMGSDDLGSNIVEAEVTTDEALKGIDCLRNLLILVLSSDKITDAGLQHVERLIHLKTLCLNSTEITEQGILKLQKTLPNCKIVR